MNKTLRYVFLTVLCGFCVCDDLQPMVNDHENVKSVNYSQYYVNNTISEVNALLYKTANKYFCKYKPIENPELVIYGTKSWSFPKQNVNLTLAYPSKNYPKRSEDPKQSYIITGFNVVLFADAKDSQGFITSGGILQDTINLTFVCSDVSLLVYEFWLYGVPKDTPSFLEADAAGLYAKSNDMCSPSVHYE